MSRPDPRIAQPSVEVVEDFAVMERFISRERDPELTAEQLYAEHGGGNCNYSDIGKRGVTKGTPSPKKGRKQADPKTLRRMMQLSRRTR
jgi:hypothetical protein